MAEGSATVCASNFFRLNPSVLFRYHDTFLLHHCANVHIWPKLWPKRRSVSLLDCMFTDLILCLYFGGQELDCNNAAKELVTKQSISWSV